MEHLELFIRSTICLVVSNDTNLVPQGYWQPEGDAHKYTVAVKVMNENTSPQSQTELLQVVENMIRI